MHEQSKKNAVVAGVNRAKAAGAATVVAASNAPTLAEAVDAVAARSLTSPSRLVHVSTIRAANVARKSHRKANVSGLACGPVAANATLPSLNSRRSNPNRCAIVLAAIMDVAERKVQVSLICYCYYFKRQKFFQFQSTKEVFY